MNDRPLPAARPGQRGHRQPVRAVRLADPPAFEIDEDERLEELATVGHGPRHLIAAAMLAARTRRAVRQTRRAETAPATTARTPKSPPSRPAKPRTAKGPAANASARKPKSDAAPTVAEPRPKLPAASPPARALTSAKLRRLRAVNQARMLDAPVDPVQVVADEQAWNRWESSRIPVADGEGLAKLDEERRSAVPRPRRPQVRSNPAPNHWRQRASAALDRLADREVERGARLERAVVGSRRRHSKSS